MFVHTLASLCITCTCTFLCRFIHFRIVCNQLSPTLMEKLQVVGGGGIEVCMYDVYRYEFCAVHVLTSFPHHIIYSLGTRLYTCTCSCALYPLVHVVDIHVHVLHSCHTYPGTQCMYATHTVAHSLFPCS